MKHCNKCDKTKGVEDFHKRSASPDGLASVCKSCQKDYDSSRLRDPKRMKMRRDYQKTARGKEKHARACARWVEKNAIKRAAHIMVGNRVRSGEILKRPCEVCGNEKANAHHDDYAKPLEVRWLCDFHHSEWHRINGEGANNI